MYVCEREMRVAGLLHVGDVIKEVDGIEVKDPDQLSDMIRRAKGSMTFKIIPSNWDQNARSHVGCSNFCCRARLSDTSKTEKKKRFDYIFRSI